MNGRECWIMNLLSLWLVNCILVLIFALAFLVSVRKERRRFRNAVFLGGAIHFAIYAIMEYTRPNLPFVLIRLDIFTFGFVLVLLLGSLVLYADSWMLWHREGPGRTALLPAAAASIALVLTFGFLAIARLTFDILWLRVINMTIMFILFFNTFVFVTLVLYTLIYSGMPVRRDFDYIVIHGAGLLGGKRISRLLASRIDKAIEVYELCGRRAKLIPSGGRGSDEDISEAEAIRNYLLEKGIPASDILIEDRSTTTMENLRYSRELIEARDSKRPYRCVFVTSNYHVLRTAVYARKMGLSGECVGAPTRMYYWISAFLREYAAILEANKAAAILWIIVWWLWFLWAHV